MCKRLEELIAEIEDVILSCNEVTQAKDTMSNWMLNKRDDRNFVQFIQPIWLRGAYLLDNFNDIKNER